MVGGAAGGAHGRAGFGSGLGSGFGGGLFGSGLGFSFRVAEAHGGFHAVGQALKLLFELDALGFATLHQLIHYFFALGLGHLVVFHQFFDGALYRLAALRNVAHAGVNEFLEQIFHGEKGLRVKSEYREVPEIKLFAQ